MAQAVAKEERRGWRVESQEDFQVVLVRMRRSTYLFHLLLAAVSWGSTDGAAGTERAHEVITVDEYGNTEIFR